MRTRALQKVFGALWNFGERLDIWNRLSEKINLIFLDQITPNSTKQDQMRPNWQCRGTKRQKNPTSLHPKTGSMILPPACTKLHQLAEKNWSHPKDVTFPLPWAQMQVRAWEGMRVRERPEGPMTGKTNG